MSILWNVAGIVSCGLVLYICKDEEKTLPVKTIIVLNTLGVLTNLAAVVLYVFYFFQGLA